MSWRRVGSWGPVLAVLFISSGCGGGHSSPHAVAATSFDRRCERASDCTAVYDGELVCCGLITVCQNAAIRTDNLSAYRDATNAQTPMCPGTLCTQPVCPGGLLTCPAGVCEFHPQGSPETADAATRTVFAAEYRQACEDVADCAPVYLGPLGCCPLGCPNAAIRQDELARYLSDVDHRTPACYPTSACVFPGICTSGRVACTGHVCELLTNASDAAASD